MNNTQKALELANNNMRYYGGEYDSYNECLNSAIEMGIWKDEQFNEEKNELLCLVDMLTIDERNQTIIEDLKELLR